MNSTGLPIIRPRIPESLNPEEPAVPLRVNEMGRIVAKNVIEDIRLHCDIVDVIGSYVTLKRAGSGHKALCPFHKEKTPSFTVNAARQIFHCFGCGAGGDVFRFVMQYEGVDFPTAMKMLADRAGIALELTESSDEERSDKDVLFKIHGELAQLYHQTLKESKAAEVARSYLSDRKLSEAIIDEFMLGYAPDRRKLLPGWAKKRGYELKHLELGGLVGRSEDDSGESFVYDRFRNRLMFPIQDEMGRVIGFSGRILGGDTRTAKYLNSPETPLFHKSRVLYAMDKARKAIADQRVAIVCEGQIDVIRCHEAGIDNAIAPQGTALTEDHARIVKRYADAVILVFDADTAGQNAALRSADVFLESGLSVRVASLPEGQDPDSVITGRGADEFRALIGEAVPAVDYQIRVLSDRESEEDDAGRMRVVRSVLESINRAPTASQQDMLLRRAASLLNITEEALRSDLRRTKHTARQSDASNEPSASRITHPAEEVTVCQLIISHPTLRNTATEHLKPEHFSDPSCRRIYEILDSEEAEGAKLTSALGEEDDETVRLVARIVAEAGSQDAEESQLIDAIRAALLVVRRKDLERKRRKLRARLKTASAKEASRLEAEGAQLTHDIHLFRQGWTTALPILELDSD
ncbi:MAG: DNA primase [Verrucomicrobia bacterium]|nr:DNA primase [Verrucomicrobiota bacterium]